MNRILSDSRHGRLIIGSNDEFNRHTDLLRKILGQWNELLVHNFNRFKRDDPKLNSGLKIQGGKYE